MFATYLSKRGVNSEQHNGHFAPDAYYDWTYQRKRNTSGDLQRVPFDVTIISALYRIDDLAGSGNDAGNYSCPGHYHNQNGGGHYFK